MIRRLSCHCGAVQIDVDLPDPLRDLIRCDCSLCRRRGAVMTGVPLSALRIVQGADALTLYRFGTRTARHHFCRHCGIYTHHRRRSNPQEYGINCGALEGVSPRDLDAARWTDGVRHPCDRPGD